MAKADNNATNTKPESLESILWASANKLRGGVAPYDYMNVVLGLVFLKYLSDRFEIKRSQLIVEGEGFEDDKDAYEAESLFWIPEKARWSYICEFAKSNEIGKILDDAFLAIEKENTSLKNILPKTYSKLEIDQTMLGELVDLFTNKLDTNQYEGDLFGKVYEYFLGEFFKSLGQKGGEFYTPRCIVELLVNMIEPYKGKIYDPACGSGGMFVQSAKFLQEHNNRIQNISIYGQEKEANTWRLARMNLAIRGIDANLGSSNADTFHDDKHPTLRADYILANPPFNISDYGQSKLQNDPRWIYGIPPQGNANYAWIQHIISKLAPNGVAGFLLANGSLSTSAKEEFAIRKAMLEDGTVDAIITLPTQLFSTVAISVCAWFLRKNKMNKGRTLFVDARDMGMMINRKTRELTNVEIQKITNIYHNWLKNENYEDIKGFCKSTSIEEIRATGYSLVPGRYVGIDDSNKLSEEELQMQLKESAEELFKLIEESKELETKVVEILKRELE